MIKRADVTFLPLIRQKFGYFKYGIFDAEGKAMAPWPLLTSFDSRFPSNSKYLKTEAPKTLSGPFVYAGSVNALFGHFLTEGGPNMLAAAQAMQSHADAKLLFHVEAGEDPGDLIATHAASWIFKTIGLDPSRIHYITEPMRAREVIFPEPAFTAKFTYAPHMASLIDQQLAGVRAGPAQKIYFSRVKWPEKAPRVVNEARVQKRFEEAGYTSIHIQEHSFEEQLQIVKGARAIAGPQGSALHWSLYARAARSVISLGWKSPLQAGICALRGQIYVNPRGRMPKPVKAPRSRIISERALQEALEQADL